MEVCSLVLLLRKVISWVALSAPRTSQSGFSRASNWAVVMAGLEVIPRAARPALVIKEPASQREAKPMMRMTTPEMKAMLVHEGFSPAGRSCGEDKLGSESFTG